MKKKTVSKSHLCLPYKYAQLVGIRTRKKILWLCATFKFWIVQWLPAEDKVKIRPSLPFFSFLQHRHTHACYTLNLQCNICTFSTKTFFSEAIVNLIFQSILFKRECFDFALHLKLQLIHPRHCMPKYVHKRYFHCFKC